MPDLSGAPCTPIRTISRLNPNVDGKAPRLRISRNPSQYNGILFERFYETPLYKKVLKQEHIQSQEPLRPFRTLLAAAELLADADTNPIQTAATTAEPPHNQAGASTHAPKPD